MRAVFIWGWLLTGCSSAEFEPIDTGDTNVEQSGPLYSDGDRVLLYYGHGGDSGRSDGVGEVENIDAHWKETYGWNTDWRDTLEGDLTAFRMIGIMGAGYEEEVPFEPPTIALLEAALDRGTRLLVVSETDNCEATTINPLLEALGAPMRFNGDGEQIYKVVQPEYIATHQTTEGVESLWFSDPCYLDANEADNVVEHEQNVLVAAYRPGNGGDIVVVGDYEFFDDSGNLEREDNKEFANRLVELHEDFARTSR